MLPVVLVGLFLRQSFIGRNHSSKGNLEAYIWKSAVIAWCDFRLISVDEDSWVTGGTAASVASHDTIMCPSNRLFVNHFDCG